MANVRILYCIDSVGYDAGTERQLAEIIKHIDKDRFDVHLCCFEEGPRIRELREHCTPLILPVRRLYTLNAFRQIRRLRRYINEQGIDVIHTFMVKAGIVGVLAARKSLCKAVIGSRRNMGYWLTPFYLRLFRYLDRHTTRLLANSERAKEFVVRTERVPPKKVDVLYNGVDMAKYACGAGAPATADWLGIPGDAKVVGIVANFRPVKDHALFLRAAREIAARVPEAAFLLVGTGPLREELARLAADLGISNKVFFTDGRGAVPGYLARMSVGCLTSHSEGFSNAILEYMAAGLPVVATDVGGNAEAVEDDATGVIVPGRDPADFAKPVIALLKDDAGRADMGRRSLERCREMFDIRASVRRHEDYYASLAEGTKR